MNPSKKTTRIFASLAFVLSFGIALAASAADPSPAEPFDDELGGRSSFEQPAGGKAEAGKACEHHAKGEKGHEGHAGHAAQGEKCPHGPDGKCGDCCPEGKCGDCCKDGKCGACCGPDGKHDGHGEHGAKGHEGHGEPGAKGHEGHGDDDAKGHEGHGATGHEGHDGHHG